MLPLEPNLPLDSQHLKLKLHQCNHYDDFPHEVRHIVYLTLCIKFPSGSSSICNSISCLVANCIGMSRWLVEVEEASRFLSVLLQLLNVTQYVAVTLAFNNDFKTRRKQSLKSVSKRLRTTITVARNTGEIRRPNQQHSTDKILLRLEQSSTEMPQLSFYHLPSFF